MEEKYEKILKEIEEIDPSFINQIGIILSAYEEGAQWLKKASLFSLNEKWFYDENANKYFSIKDYFISFWEPILGFLPDIKPGILRFGEIDGTTSGGVPWIEYPQFLLPLNESAEQFLKNNSPSRICELFEAIGDTWVRENGIQLSEGVATWPLNRFIYSLKTWEERIKRFTEAYDIGCPVIMLVSNIPHEVAHTFHYIHKRYWKRTYSEDRIIYYYFVSNYLNEGIAELCQLISIKPILEKFPMLKHDNLLKHYIYAQKSIGNNHTWGLLWMLTAYEILGRDFKKLFFLATRPGISFEDFIYSKELQTEKVLAISKDTSPITLHRQKRRKGLPHTYIFPSCVIEFDGKSFKIIPNEKEN